MLWHARSLKTLIDRILPLTAMPMHKVGEHYEHNSRADTSICASS